jgi:hypothetical protein
VVDPYCSPTSFTKRVRGLVVMIVACQVMDPGSIPGERNYSFLVLKTSFLLVREQQKEDPGNRSRTSDLEISVVAIYSLPLCQLSYTRMFELHQLPPLPRTKEGLRTAKQKAAVCGDRTHALTNQRLKLAP